MERRDRRGSWNSEEKGVLRERNWSTVACFREFKDRLLGLAIRRPL